MNTQDLKQMACNQLEIISLQVELLQYLYSLNQSADYEEDNYGG